jgi:hypothetical protein
VAADQATPRARGGRAAAGSAGNLAAGPGRPETDPRRTTAYGTAYDTAGTGATRQSAEADSVAYLPADSVAHARAGHNRFVWNLRLEGVRPVEGVVNDEGTYDGAMVPPGRYAVRLTVDGHTESRPFTVVDDPRMGASPAELAAAYDYTRRTVAKVNEVADAARHIADVKRALEARVAAAKGQPYARQVTDAARPVIDSLEAVRAELVDVHSQVDQITLHYPVKVYNQLLNVNRMAQSFDRAPTEQAHAVLRELGAQVDALVGRMRALERNEVEAFNRLVAGLPMPAVPVAAPAAVP